MATFTITSLLNSGMGSLRDAINMANATTAENDTINFGVTGTIELSSEQLTISDDLTIDGPGANLLSVDANDLFRVFNVDDGTASLIDIDIEGLTIPGGNEFVGGGILNFEDLEVTNSTLSGNTADREGGGILNHGTLTVTNSTLSGNTANYGGGISGDGNTTVTSTIIAANTAENDVFGDFISGGNNLIGNGDGATGFTQSTDQVGTTDNPINPLLGLLANNGGLTQTHNKPYLLAARL